MYQRPLQARSEIKKLFKPKLKSYIALHCLDRVTNTKTINTRMCNCARCWHSHDVTLPQLSTNNIFHFKVSRLPIFMSVKHEPDFGISLEKSNHERKWEPRETQSGDRQINIRFRREYHYPLYRTCLCIDFTLKGAVCSQYDVVSNPTKL